MKKTCLWLVLIFSLQLMVHCSLNAQTVQTNVYVAAVTDTASAGTPTPPPVYVETTPGLYTPGSTTKVSVTGLDPARAGSRFFREGATTNSSFTVTPTLLSNRTYNVYFATTSSSRSSDLVVRISVTNCTTTMPATSTAWRSGLGGSWQLLGRITVNPGITNPSVIFSYASGTLVLASPSQRFWSDGYWFELLPLPNITTHPQSRTNAVGSTATFSVTATGTAPITYRWYFNQTNLITGATSATLTLSNVQFTNMGTYSCLVSNVGGTIMSSNATLTVIDVPLAFTSEPVSQTVNAGANATFTATANGTPPLSYQWLFNSIPISGATTNSYTVLNAQTNAIGNYSVTVTNTSGGNITSSNAFLTVNPVAPTITTQPLSRTIYQGSNVLFTVAATGSEPFSYQWKFNNADILNATNSSYTRPNVQLSDSGNYQVIVSNSVGFTPSSVAVLTVTNDQPRITSQPQDQTNNAGTTATFSVAALGLDPKSYQWRFNSGDISGATNASYSISNVQTNHQGTYSVAISNRDGVTLSANATLTVIDIAPVITSGPTPSSLTIGSGSSASFSASATGTEPISFQWQFNTADIPGATNSTYTLNNAQTNNSGNYRVLFSNRVGTTTSSDALLTVTNSGPQILSHPQSVTNNAGTTASFSVSAQGVSLQYQWQFNGTNIAGETKTTLTLANVQTNNAGSYAAVVSNSQGSSTSSNATLTVINTAPIITSQPAASQTVNSGSDASFSVTTTGSDPRRYQWRFNGSPIANATATSYTQSNVQFGDSGNYDVVITNSFGSVTSSVSQLTVVVPPPTITQQPQSRSVTAGSNIIFTVTASSGVPMTYQWYLNGAPIAGATGTSYTKVNAQSNGTYKVIVSNTTGGTPSADANLTVTPSAPIITQQPAGATVLAGQNATFTVATLGSDQRNYQWKFGGVNIAGATSTSYTVVDAQAANRGNYTVFVSNGLGNVTSAAAALNVLDSAPIITQQPASQKVSVGSCVTFSVNHAGTKPVSYQWFYNSSPIPGAYEQSITVYDVQPSDAGTLSVRISNGFGLTNSATAALQVVSGPFISNIGNVGTTNLTVTWSAIPGRSYRLEYKTNLASGSWTAVGTNQTATDCTGVQVDTNGSSGPRFYRLVLLP